MHRHAGLGELGVQLVVFQAAQAGHVKADGRRGVLTARTLDTTMDDLAWQTARR
ncbi:hypothetical protein ACFC18_49005 [Streptomyces sp. NPDC056121]|uniref:hypothetical protein n=1 Tax=Streptomyces sp. NPDC056121 TaxID=3345718 RepID=UPI0035D892CB